jgi:queuine tRNA-ribosyltransferase
MGSDPIRFTIEHALPTGARAGVITTPHGSFKTPAFVPVGTKGTVKAVLPRELKETVGAEVILANTYHLFLQPGDELIRDAGGLHKFMAWNGPLVTDSGGFQVFSLGAAFGKGITKFTAPAAADSAAPAVYDEDIASKHGKLAVVDEEGVTFTSHIDGSLHRFTPERSIEIQHNLGADIFFAFDEPTSPNASREYQKDSMARTHAWAKRSLRAHRLNLTAQTSQAIFGIVQGGPHPDLRAESAGEIASMDFDGYGIGGSYSKQELEVALSAAIKPLRQDLPRHLLGIGEPEDVFEGVARGIDMFDCVQPTRMARTGTLYTARGKVNLMNEKYIRDFSPLDEGTGGAMSEQFTKAYLAHLFRAKEMLAATIASIHNLYFMQKLMSQMRESLAEGRFESHRESFLSRYRGQRSMLHI